MELSGDLIKLLGDANTEIKRLQKENDMMRLRLNMFDDCMMMVRASSPRNDMQLHANITYGIDKFLESAKAQ